MMKIYLALIIIISGIFLYYYNRRDATRSAKEILLISLMELLPLVSFLILTTFLGIIDTFLWITMAFIMSLFILLIRLRDKNHIDHDSDLKLESIKNSFISVNITFLPFVMALTIFRFLPWYVQIPLSILSSILIYFLSKVIQKQTSNIIKKFSIKIDFSGSRGSIAWYSLIVVFIVFFLFFTFPSTPINRLLNLENSTLKFEFLQGYDNDLNAGFDSSYISRSKLASNIYDPGDPDITTDEPITVVDYINSDAISVFWDTENNIRYEAYVDLSLNTTYVKYAPGVPVETYTINGIHNVRGYVIDDIIYLTNNQSEHIEIMDNSFEINDIINIYTSYSFYRENSYELTDVLFSVVDNQLQYTIIERQNDSLFQTSFSIIEKDINLVLPFYSHFSFYNILLLIIIMFIPITDYSKTITVLDFENKLKETVKDNVSIKSQKK